MFNLDKKLMSLSFQYFRSLEEERRSFHAMNRYKEAKQAKSLSFINFCYKLRKFAALLEYETSARCILLEPQDQLFTKVYARSFALH